MTWSPHVPGTAPACIPPALQRPPCVETPVHPLCADHVQWLRIPVLPLLGGSVVHVAAQFWMKSRYFHRCLLHLGIVWRQQRDRALETPGRVSASSQKSCLCAQREGAWTHCVSHAMWSSPLFSYWRLPSYALVCLKGGKKHYLAMSLSITEGCQCII